MFDAASDEDIEAIESLAGVRLPAYFREFLRQNTYRHSFEHGFECLSMERIRGEWTDNTGKLEAGEFVDLAERLEVPKHAVGRLREVWWSRSWIPFAGDSNGNLLCIDLDPGPNGRPEQVIQFIIIATERRLFLRRRRYRAPHSLPQPPRNPGVRMGLLKTTVNL